MIEKLWHSTLQKKRGIVLTGGPNPTAKKEIGHNDEYTYKDNNIDIDGENEDEIGGDDEGEVVEGLITGEDGWPSLEAMSRMDSHTKLRWMMKMMVVPPCWKERKVRLFGAFGVLEEKVLQ
jgi:hypothetical protein